MIQVTASSFESKIYPAENVIDGDTTSRWSSGFADDQWLTVDLGQSKPISQVTVVWERATAKQYHLSLSADGTTWTDLPARSAPSGGGADPIDLPPGTEARFIKVHCHQRTTEYGFSIYEIMIDGQAIDGEDLPTPPDDAPYKNADLPPDTRADDLVSRMSVREKIRYISGIDMFYLKPNDRLGLPRLTMADASMGVRGNGRSTAFPSFITLAASWNPELSARYGQAVASECRAKGVHFLLGPGVNIYRLPQCGRNFEYLGEDPYLASQLVVPYIQQVQAQGVAATVKHFAANNSDWHRKVSNSVVDERTLHEIYYPAFRAAVQEADVHAVMTAYNLVNGEYAAEHHGLIQGTLRGQWGFDGLVMSDWWSVWDTKKAALSGLDLEMPHGDYFNRATLEPLLEDGTISEADLDRMVRNIASVCFEMGFYDRPQKDESYTEYGPAHDAIALEVSQQGIVLLKNDDAALPLDRQAVNRIAVVGANANTTLTSGLGAAKVEPFEPVMILDAIRDAAGDAAVDYHETPTAAIANADVVVVSIVVVEREATDRPFELPTEQADLIRGALQHHDRVILLITSGGAVGLSEWVEDLSGIVQCWHTGNVGATAIAQVLFGDINPSGKLPISFERTWESSAAYHNYMPEGGEHIDEPVWGREREQFDIVYEEGVFVGYRHFDHNQIDPLFCFGHGLSYTTFSYDQLTLASNTLAPDGGLTVQVTITNTGDRDGAEVVQLYVADEQASLPRPPKELKGFARVELKAGESKTVTLHLTPRDLAYYDAATGRWVAEPGTFKVHLGASSRDMRLTATFDLTARWEGE